MPEIILPAESGRQAVPRHALAISEIVKPPVYQDRVFVVPQYLLQQSHGVLVKGKYVRFVVVVLRIYVLAVPAASVFPADDPSDAIARVLQHILRLCS